MRIKAGQRKTKQRQVILEELQRLRTHPTASELYEVVRQRLPRLSLGTVYRNLELLVESGFARKIESAGGQARFDGDLSQHYHVRCEECGEVADVFGLPSDIVRGEFEELNGYRVSGYKLEFVGLCPHCQNGKSNQYEETGDAPSSPDEH